jgi:hypothetical protein
MGCRLEVVGRLAFDLTDACLYFLIFVARPAARHRRQQCVKYSALMQFFICFSF